MTKKKNKGEFDYSKANLSQVFYEFFGDPNAKLNYMMLMNKDLNRRILEKMEVIKGLEEEIKILEGQNKQDLHNDYLVIVKLENRIKRLKAKLKSKSK